MIGRDTFSALAPARGLQPKNWLCDPIPQFMAVSMIRNMWHSSCYEYRMRHSWLTKVWGFMLGPARTEYREPYVYIFYTCTCTECRVQRRCSYLLFTGSHINQDPRCTQNPYITIFSHHIRSWLICTPVLPGIGSLSWSPITQAVWRRLLKNEKYTPSMY